MKQLGKVKWYGHVFRRVSCIAMGRGLIRRLPKNDGGPVGHRRDMLWMRVDWLCHEMRIQRSRCMERCDCGCSHWKVNFTSSRLRKPARV